MTILQFANNALSALASPITSADTTIYLQAGTGSLFPTPTSGQVFLATIYNSSSTSYEIVLVTARSGDTVTVVRAQENTTAQTWLTGNSFGMYPTKGTMQSLVQADQLQNGTYTYAIGGGTANALTAQITSNLTAIPDGMNFVIKAIATNTDAATLQLTLGSTILSVAPIIKGNSYPLIANDIWTNYPCIFTWSATLGAFILQNPGTSVVPPITTYSADYVVVAGGGGASQGGGGAGGYIASTASLTHGNTYNIIVGAGGSSGAQGGNSQIAGLIVTVGGGAGGGAPGGVGGSGGSGAGGTSQGNRGTVGGGSGTLGQGNNGGASLENVSPDQGQGGGGGGGAGAAGADSANDGTSGGAGGVGLSTIITGSTLYLAGGGGGAGWYGSGASGGNGGGGRGADYNYGTNNSNGSPNTGGGAGGGITATNGGSGVVYISVATSNYTGITTGSPTITVNGSKTVMKFTTSGTYTA